MVSQITKEIEWVVCTHAPLGLKVDKLQCNARITYMFGVDEWG